jgi:hypothetical protein
MSAEAPKSAKLFGGELLIQPDGIWTAAHAYEHPQTGREVTIIGTNHGGDKKYYDDIDYILEAHDIVIFEASMPPAKSEQSSKIKSSIASGVGLLVEKYMLAQLHRPNPEKAFIPAVSSYFGAAQKVYESQEGQAFDYTQPNWISGDGAFFRSLDKKKIEEAKKEFMEGVASVPKEQKKEIVDHMKNGLKKIRRGTFEKRDLGEGFITLYSDPKITAVLNDIVAKPRDEMVLKTFDRIVEEHDPESVAIKFGAAHIGNQRRMLEERGYVHQATVLLRNIKF